MALYQALGSAVEMSGGSAANTMCGVAASAAGGATSARSRDDDLGEVFGHDLRAVGVHVPAGAPTRPTCRPAAASSSSRPTRSAR